MPTQLLMTEPRQSPQAVRSKPGRTLGQIIFEAFDKMPLVYAIKPPFAELQITGRGNTCPPRTFELQNLRICKSLTGRVVAIHASQHPMSHAEINTMVPERLLDGIQDYMTTRGAVIGLAIYGDIHLGTDTPTPADDWVRQHPNYPYCISIVAAISFKTPIPHLADPGSPSRGLSLTAAALLGNALISNQFTLEVGNKGCFRTKFLANLRNRVLHTWSAQPAAQAVTDTTVKVEAAPSPSTLATRRAAAKTGGASKTSRTTSTILGIGQPATPLPLDRSRPSQSPLFQSSWCLQTSASTKLN
jgi:hypothetical protein